MEPWSRMEGIASGMIYTELEIENQVDLSNVLLAKWDRDFLKELIAVTADPDTHKAPISQDKLAKIAKVSQKTISNLLDPKRDPAWSSVQKVGEALGVHFVADFNDSINNQTVLDAIKKRRF